jgi:glycosyltransferase involved in cell wall biosynthesis
MRIAVFTSQFPSRVSTFFARDMRALVAAGASIDVFPIYPLEPELWRYVPPILDERFLPRERVHHVGLAEGVRSLRPWPLRRARTFARDALAIARSAARFGLEPLAKSAYVLPKAWAWADQLARGGYDHVLAFWGNYAATCAYVAHRLLARDDIPFSFFLHAGTDLYRNRVFMREKLLYAGRVVTVCEFNRRLIRDAYPDIWPAIADRVTVNYMGVDFSELPYAPGPRPEGRVLAVGRQSRGRGYDLLIRAVAELLRRGMPVELEFVGGGEDGPRLRAIARELGVTGRVHFRGWAVFEEAMALGTPVLGSTISGIPELLDHGRCGALVPPGNLDALTGALASLLADPARRAAYAEAARAHAEQSLDMWRNGAQLFDSLRRAPAPGA